MTGKTRHPPAEPATLRLVFLGGAPRSGTTLVQNILANHPAVCGGPEFEHIPDIVALRNVLQAAIRSPRRGTGYLSAGDIDSAVATLIRSLLSSYKTKEACHILCEKTPSNVLVLNDLVAIFPEAKFLFCIRDPRAVAASLLAVGKRAKGAHIMPPLFTTNINFAINVIRKFNAAALRSVDESDRVMAIVYERLIQAPEQEVKRICEFLDIPWHADMIHPDRKPHSHNGGVDGIWYDVAKFRSAFDANRLTAWKHELSATQAAMVARAFVNDRRLKALGYDLSEAETTRAARNVARLRLALFGVGYRLAHGSLSLVGRLPGVRRLLSELSEKLSRDTEHKA